LTNLSRCANEHFSMDRWFLTGMSAAFMNVLGSGTSRQYATSNRLIERMIRTDLEGDRTALAAEMKHFNVMMRSMYETGIGYLNNFSRNASFDVWWPFFGASIANYFNVAVPSGTTDFEHEFHIARSHGTTCSCSLETALGKDTPQLRAAVARRADEMLAF